MVVAAQLGDQRLESSPVKASVEPDFNHLFTFQLRIPSSAIKDTVQSADMKAERSWQDDAEALLNTATPLRLCVLRQDHMGERLVMSNCDLDWRKVQI